MSSSYDGPPLDDSWQDLKDVWEERDFEILKQNTNETGQTVGGTTDDDLGEETTTFIPAAVNTDELTDAQRQIIEAAAMRPTASRYEISAVVDRSPQYVADVCGRFLPDHPAAAPPPESEETSAQTTLDAWGGTR